MKKQIPSPEPCPKCGGYGVKFSYIGHFKAVCDTCGHSSALEESKPLAMESWNRESKAGK
ncbi:hypothetical protein [Maridesulfovibrio ferrireducens]|uniref:hypothetical protein n=1 Tax=Maridesulfovibrio ferrireducens TaxID=246191 RepID=UPI001A1D7506|nr:hypothetical protein [Maridesulfovibrio ferrireducens]MBI9110263.1 hypothetical protein [Maridesulfovibrio ferrireducens]